jgi:hypothetical protein
MPENPRIISNLAPAKGNHAKLSPVAGRSFRAIPSRQISRPDMTDSGACTTISGKLNHFAKMRSVARGDLQA